jgi:7-carboxy-7-deazaguanine synthase
MRVCEIFTGIQGESTYAGLPCTFVRLSGCNLRCAYCDTTYAHGEVHELSIRSILSDITRRGVSLVQVTGGEPLLQMEVRGVISALLDKGYTVLVETNGSIFIGDVDPRAIIILDVKTPGSGMSDRIELRNIPHLKAADQVKFVLTSRADYEWAREFIERYALSERCTVLMSPVYGQLDARLLVRWILEDVLPVRLNLQLHKLVFGPDRRGV